MHDCLITAGLRTSFGWAKLDRPSGLVNVLLTRGEIELLAAGLRRSADEADQEGRHDAANALFSRVTALREAAR